jgi:predicted dehydrogenase
VAVSFTFRNGGAGTIVGTAGTKTIYPFFELCLSFANGRITFRGLDGDMETARLRQERARVLRHQPPVVPLGLYNQSFGKSANAYLDAVAKGNPPPVPGLAGLRELQFEAAMRKSIRTGLPVTPDTDFPCGL